MKKLALEIIASFLLMILFIMLIMIIILSGRGYTKDNLEYRSKVIDLSENTQFDYLSKSVVQIFVSREGSAVFGTGFFISKDNKVVTNFHVIDGAAKIYVALGDDKYAYEAYIFAFDKANDLAILSVPDVATHDYLPITLDVFKDENIYTCGFADEYTITQGNVLDTKSLYKNNYYIDTSNVVMEGNSGGPAINENGEVVGIVTLGNSVSTSLVPSYKLYSFIYNLNISL